jgi:hypothetical protein
MRRGTWAILVALVSGGPLALADAVAVRVLPQTYPVQTGRKSRPNWSGGQAARLKGKTSYTTEAVVLENRYLRITVLPELGGRLVRAVYKPTNAQLFWEFDRIVDGVSWSMGGCRWSFPFWEHGRHFDETGGYVVAQHDDGSATLAIDMRFGDFLRPSETLRYGRATNLRLVQTVHLSPDSAAFTWTGRVDNPLPVRHGFKLWYLMRQPSTEGVHVILPAGGVTDHGAPALKAWEADTRVGSRQFSLFAIGIRHGFAGWYFPKRDLNVLRVVDPARAPGAKQVLYPSSRRGYIEMWGGNHEVFEECGRFLPAFGGFEIPVTVLAATGIGPADFANEHAAVSCRRRQGSWRIAIATARPIRGATLVVVGKGRTWTKGDVSISPQQPLKATFADDGKVVRLVLKDAVGRVLLDQRFPVDVGPMPHRQFSEVRARVKGQIPGGTGLYAEAMDLVTEHQPSLVRTAKRNAAILAESEDFRGLLDAARRLMRVRKGAPEVLAGLEKVLAGQPDSPWANLYKAMWLIEAGKGSEAAACLRKAKSLPGGRYLMALAAIGAKDFMAAQTHLEALLGLGVEATFYGADDPALQLLQPGAFVSATGPRLLLAVVLKQQSKAEQARDILERLLATDPACIEAWMLLGEGEKVRTLTARNASGKRAAEQTLQALRAGKWQGIGRP